MAAQGGADHRRRDAHAKVQQLPLDALVAPTRVLPGQTNDQPLDILVQWRPAYLAMRVGPGAGHEPPVPAQQRLGRDEEARPAGPGEHATDRGEQGPVVGPSLGRGALAAEHGELLAQDEDLKVLSSVTASKQHEQLDGAAQREVGEFGQDQGGLRRVDRAHSVELQSGVNQQIRSRVRPLRTLQAELRSWSPRSDSNRRPSDESDVRRRSGWLEKDLACSRGMPRRSRRFPTDTEGSSG
jgi:hypothetical protein